MEFDHAGSYDETHFEILKREFEAEGYSLPELVRPLFFKLLSFSRSSSSLLFVPSGLLEPKRNRLQTRHLPNSWSGSRFWLLGRVAEGLPRGSSPLLSFVFLLFLERTHLTFDSSALVQGGDYPEDETFLEVDAEGNSVETAAGLDPIAVMQKAIGHESFAGLKVVA